MPCLHYCPADNSRAVHQGRQRGRGPQAGGSGVEGLAAAGTEMPGKVKNGGKFKITCYRESSNSGTTASSTSLTRAGGAYSSTGDR